jgi:hypothetical protein
LASFFVDKPGAGFGFDAEIRDNCARKFQFRRAIIKMAQFDPSASNFSRI